ncbi:MAG: hypothetical protein QNJ63_00335 [Calothrix sp. MO_192.B10]|nr:hypothetical protein [Calothrix sp. MO_192.B10]
MNDRELLEEIERLKMKLNYVESNINNLIKVGVYTILTGLYLLFFAILFFTDKSSGEIKRINGIFLIVTFILFCFQNVNFNKYK